MMISRINLLMSLHESAATTDRLRSCVQFTVGALFFVQCYDQGNS